MKELLDSLDTDFDEAEGWIRIVDAGWTADDLKLNLSIHFRGNRAPELWEVMCLGVVEESLTSRGGDVLICSTKSPLLRPFVEPEVDIMFTENDMAADALLGIVCSCCIELMGRPEKIARFLNGIATIDGIAGAAFGLLGRFPESLATRILNDLRDKPIRAIALPGRPPKRWNGSQYEDYQPLQALEIGQSYVLAEQFNACRL